MPELPDVEALRRYLLAQGIQGRRITGMTLHWPKAVREPAHEEFSRRIVGRTIVGVDRRAKFLLFKLDQGFLVIHLRMTGSLIMVSQSYKPHPLTRTEFELDEGLRLDFVDGRKLGAMWLVNDTAPLLAALGPEPLEDSFTLQVMVKRLKGRKAPIKPLLLEQGVIAGIGNIYADEILFAAAIHPMRPSDSLTDKEMEALHKAMRRILQEATDNLGHLLPIEGPPTESREGSKVLHMPRSEDVPCPKCSRPVQRRVIRGRSAYLCPHCQK